MIRSYSELIKRTDFVARYRYLRLPGEIGMATFGFDRDLNQRFYASPAWKTARDIAIVRDDGCDLGVPGKVITGRILVHHMNPMLPDDIYDNNPDITNPEYLICVSHATHNAIHFGDENQLPTTLVERRPGDTTLW